MAVWLTGDAPPMQLHQGLVVHSSASSKKLLLCPYGI